MAQGVVTEFQNLHLECDKMIEKTTITSVTTAGAATYTAAACMGGVIMRDPNGASRTDVLPTAALLVAAMYDPQIGDTITVRIINTADAAETITMTAGSGGAFDAAQTAASKVIAQDKSGTLIIRVTGVSTAAYVVYMAV